MANKLKLGVLASGSGTNLQAIIDSCENNLIPAEVVVVLSDVRDAYALKRAGNAGIENYFINPKEFDGKEKYEAQILNTLNQHSVELVVLAGYMRLIGKRFLESYPQKIINVHPSLLPSFPGAQGIKDAYDYGVKITGATIHFVDEGTDTGPVILQEVVKILEEDTLETLEEKIHKVEHKIYPEAIKLFAECRVNIDGRKVRLRRGLKDEG